MGRLRRRTRAWAGAVAVLLAMPLLVATQRASAADPPVRIMLVGDSITEGSSGDWTWRYRLAHYLDAAGVDYEFVGPRTTMLDLATNQHTSTDYADPAFDRHHFARWGESLHAILAENAAVPEDAIGTAVATYQPDVVVELLGINDLLYGSSPQETLDVAHDFVDEVRAAKPDTTVVMSTVPGEQYAHVADYNVLLRDNAPGWSLPSSTVVVSDPAPAWQFADDTCDNTHPSAAGEVKIAAAEADTLAALGIGAPAPRPLPTPAPGPRLPAVLDVVRGDGHAILTWQLPPGGDAVLISTHDVTAGAPWRQLPFAIGGNSWDSGGLVNGHTYEFRLNVLKHHCLASDVDSNVAQVTPEPDAPGDVAGLTVSALDHGVRASWDNTAGADAYSVWFKPSDTEDWSSVETTGTTADVLGLQAGRSYDVAVLARNDGGAGPRSASAQVVPTGVTPQAPRWTGAQGSARGTATVTWSAVTHANAYRLAYRLARPGAAWTTYAGERTTGSAVVTGLRDGERYTFRVRGADDRVLGPWSAGQVVTVPKVGPVRAVVARALDDGRIRTRGTSVRDADGYTVAAAGSGDCRHEPAQRRFAVVAKGLHTPRHTFGPAQRDRAVWVRWRASFQGVSGGLVRSSTACLPR